MKKNISYIPMDSTLEIWLLEKLIKEPPKSDCVEDFLSGIRDIIGELEIHPKSRKVLQKGSEISLTPKEFDILYFLAQNRGEVFTKEQIYRAVWEDDYLLDDSNIMAFIRKLRKKIEPAPDAPKYILTIWGIGYKFNDQL